MRSSLRFAAVTGVAAITGLACARATALESAPVAGESAPVPGVALGEPLRGVAWQGSPRPVPESELDALVACHVNALTQTPFAAMPDPHKPVIRWRASPRGFW